MTKPPTSFKARSYLVISDIHLGARVTTAKEILDHLTAFFDNFSPKCQFNDIDVLFLAGDIWDETIVFSSDVIKQAIPFFGLLGHWCVRNKVKLRILEGTPRHDRRQSETIKVILNMLPIDLDFKYVSALSTEYMEDIDLSVLYVPDECRPTADIIARDVENILLEDGYDKVDIAIMHGMFKYQLGTIPMNSKVHDEAFYLEKVKHYINVGHIHTASQYNRILAQGSFDRLAHGEEDPKGAILVKETAPGEWAHFFIENKEAKTFKTVVVKGDMEKALKSIDAAIHKLPAGSQVRIQAISTHPILQAFETLRQKYPLFSFTKKAIAEKEVVKKTLIDTPIDYRPIVLNRDTLTQAVFGEVTLQNDMAPGEEARLFALLEEMHD